MAFFMKWYEGMNQCQSFICFMGTKAIGKCTIWGEEAISLNNFFSCWSSICIMKTKANCKCTKWFNFFSYGLPFVVWKQMRIGGAQCKDLNNFFMLVFHLYLEIKASCKCAMWICETNSLNYFTLIICVKGRWCVNMPISSMHNINELFLPSHLGMKKWKCLKLTI